MKIIFCGFMGSGKSYLKDRLGVGIDLDQKIEQQLGPIGPWIRTHGLSAFREKEFQCLQESIQATDQWLFLGGGTLDHSPSRELILNSGLLVWLETPFEVCWERIQGDPNRPLLDKGRDEVEKLFNSRQKTYALAHCRLKENERDLDAQALSELIRRKSQNRAQ